MSLLYPYVLAQRLEDQKRKGLYRCLQRREGIDFSSNDYLGFSTDQILKNKIIDRLKEFPVGSTGSRLLQGNLCFYEEVERNLAQFVGQEAALVFSSGYQANVALLSSLLRKGDIVFSDQLNHASLVDAIRLSRAYCLIYEHNNMKNLEEKILRACSSSLDSTFGASSSPPICYIVTESIFSMEGDHAPLRQLVELSKKYGVHLIVDEAHATGLYGMRGGGLIQELQLEKNILASIHTGGKALGVSGAWIAGSQILREYLINFSRPFIFSTAPAPALFVSLFEAMSYWSQVGRERAQKVLLYADQLRTYLKDCIHNEINNNKEMNQNKMKVLGERSPIIPLVVRDIELTLALSRHLKEAEIDVKPIRYPSVPEDQSRLRMTVSFNHLDDLEKLEKQLILLITTLLSKVTLK